MTTLMMPLPCQATRRLVSAPRCVPRLEARWYNTDVTPPPPVPENPAPTPPEIPSRPEPVGVPDPLENPIPVREPPSTRPPQS